MHRICNMKMSDFFAGISDGVISRLFAVHIGWQSPPLSHSWGFYSVCRKTSILYAIITFSVFILCKPHCRAICCGFERVECWRQWDFSAILSGILCAEKFSGYSQKFVVVLCADKESETKMSEKRIKTTGNIFKRANGYGGTIRYVDEDGQDKRKSFSGKTKAEVKRKFKDFIINFNRAVTGGNEKYMKLKDSMQTWLECFKAPSVERTTYDRLDSMARIHIYPALGDKVLHTIKAVDIKKFLNDKKEEGYSYSTVKKMHSLFHDYFRYIMEQEILDKDPMRSVSMIKKKNFYEEEIPTCDTITVFTDEEIVKLKDECFKTWDTGKRVYQQSAAYIFMLNTGLRAGEMLGLLNSDIDLENRVVHIRQGVKEVQKRDGFEKIPGREIEVGKPKSATSKRTVPLNNTAIEMVQELRNEFYFGEDSPLVCVMKTVAIPDR